MGACFRCTPNVLAAAQAIIGAHQQPNRIPKNHVSLYGNAIPPLAGIVHRWRFPSGISEARAIAESCRDLIAAGIHPREILVLVSNQRALLSLLDAEFQTAGVAYEPPRAKGFLDSKSGRLVLAIARIVCDTNDYVAHRVLWGSRTGVGVGTCNTISSAVIANHLNYRAIFYQPVPPGIFTGRRLTAMNSARAICAQIQGCLMADTVGQRVADMSAIVGGVFNAAEAQAWEAYAATLPPGMTLEELQDCLWADTDEQQAGLMQTLLTRLGLPIPDAGVLPPRVRVMTMHGAKGLSAKIAFVPGLEEEILPGSRRQPYPGPVLEAARLLYVSITRARAACVLSYASTRLVHGQFAICTPSRFAANLGGQLLQRNAGLTAAEVQQIVTETANLC